MTMLPMKPRPRRATLPRVAAITTVGALLTAGLVLAAAPVPAAGQNRMVNERADKALAEITIPDAGDVRGNVTLPTTVAAVPGAVVKWTSSNPDIVSDRAHGALAAGVVRRPSTWRASWSRPTTRTA